MTSLGFPDWSWLNLVASTPLVVFVIAPAVVELWKGRKR